MQDKASVFGQDIPKLWTDKVIYHFDTTTMTSNIIPNYYVVWVGSPTGDLINSYKIIMLLDRANAGKMDRESGTSL